MPRSAAWYLVAPLLAFVVIGIMTGLLRWSLRRSREPRVKEANQDLGLFGDREDYGLLIAAALTDDRETAHQVRRILADAGIRTTMAAAPGGRFRVLVFAEEVARARRLVDGSPELQD